MKWEYSCKSDDLEHWKLTYHEDEYTIAYVLGRDDGKPYAVSGYYWIGDKCSYLWAGRFASLGEAKQAVVHFLLEKELSL